jgi:chromosome segregation ATPase
MARTRESRSKRHGRGWGLPRTRGLTRALAVGLAVIGVGVASLAVAQVPRSSPDAQLIEEYQQAVSARDQLQTQNAKLKSELATAQQELRAARSQLASSKSSAGATRSALAKVRAQSQDYATQLDRAHADLKTLIGRFGDTIVSLRALEASRGALRQQLAASRTALDTCVERNADLYGVAEQVLHRYEHQGLFRYLARYEPFTRLEQTRIDNYVDDYRQRAQALRVQRPADEPNAGKSAASKKPLAPPAARKP